MSYRSLWTMIQQLRTRALYVEDCSLIDKKFTSYIEQILKLDLTIPREVAVSVQPFIYAVIPGSESPDSSSIDSDGDEDNDVSILYVAPKCTTHSN